MIDASTADVRLYILQVSLDAQGTFVQVFNTDESLQVFTDSWIGNH